MISVHVRVVGSLIRPQGRSDFEHQCVENTTAAELLAELGYSAQHIPFVMVAVNGAREKHSRVLADGDDVLLSATVGGG